MDSTQNLDQTAEIKKVHQLLAKNIDDFKYLVLCNMRLEEKSKPSDDILHLDVNRISDFEVKPTETLEEWVNRDLASQPVKKEVTPVVNEKPGEPLEQWVARQRVRPKRNKTSRTIIDIVEQWLINEAKKDLFAEIDALNGGPEKLSSEHIRELGMNLIALADKLDKMKPKTPIVVKK